MVAGGGEEGGGWEGEEGIVVFVSSAVWASIEPRTDWEGVWAGSKTDDDAYTIMPTLLNHLLSLDPREPTYTGSTLGCSYRPHMYYQGLGYALSYGVVSHPGLLPDGDIG